MFTFFCVASSAPENRGGRSLQEGGRSGRSERKKWCEKDPKRKEDEGIGMGRGEEGESWSGSGEKDEEAERVRRELKADSHQPVLWAFFFYVTGDVTLIRTVPVSRGVGSLQETRGIFITAVLRESMVAWLPRSKAKSGGEDFLMKAADVRPSIYL